MEKELTRSHARQEGLSFCAVVLRVRKTGTHGRIRTRTGHALDVLSLLLDYVGNGSGASDRFFTRILRLTRSAHLSATLASLIVWKVERHAGAAPASPAWKAGVLAVGRMAQLHFTFSI